MKNRVNKREINLATVSPDKAEEDLFQTSGIFAVFYYFDSQVQKQHKVEMVENRLAFATSKDKVPNDKYMYAVGKNGALYIGNPVVHSQFKAGKPTQSAGWLDYQFDGNIVDITIDNCSGHYTPTLSQFLSTLHGLHQANVLPNKFNIKLNRFTKIDYEEMDKKFWKNAIEEGSSKGEASQIISVTYLLDIDGFIFEQENLGSCTLSKKEIFQFNNDLGVSEK